MSLRGSDGIDHQEPNHHRALQDNQIALYLIKDTEDGKTLQQGKRPDRTDNIQLNDGTIYEVLGCIFLFQECLFLGLCFSFLPGFLRIP